MMRVISREQDGIADDRTTLIFQIGREPRGSYKPCVRCGYGRPTVVETAPLLEDGSPFPTLYYLTCPWLVERVGALESAGAVDEYAAWLASDGQASARMSLADAEYRSRRTAAAGGTDPVPGVGIAGQRDPLATKCLHAHVATWLSGIDDPVGEAVLQRIADSSAIECPDDMCAPDPDRDGDAR